MAEYIEKDKLRLMKAEECAGHTIEYAMGWKACIDWIKALPAANVRENVKGEWLLAHRGTIAEGLYCSVCGKHGRGYFCHNCGADMRGGDNG